MTGAVLTVKPARDGRWDLVSLGEVMLRFDPGEERLASARTFRVWEGGGEYNVARNLARAFGHATAIVTALVDNPVGRLVEDLVRQGGVDVSLVRWLPHDGVGRAARNGLNFTERGFGERGALGCYDRGHTAIAQLRPGDVDWEHVFGTQGARWFHTGGIFCGLSDAAPAVAKEAMQAARRHGTVVSYDLNYRESLWRSAGGRARFEAITRELVPLADVLFGIDGADAPPSPRAREAVDRGLERTFAAFPNLQLVATTLRHVRSATVNDFGAVCRASGRTHEAPLRENLAVLDRIGSGDAFAAGVIDALLAGRDAQYAVECGAACGALAMTTPGDSLFATRAEIEKLMRGGGAGAAR